MRLARWAQGREVGETAGRFQEWLRYCSLTVEKAVVERVRAVGRRLTGGRNGTGWHVEEPPPPPPSLLLLLKRMHDA